MSESKHQEVKIGTGRVIVTEEGIVFSGGSIPILADPVEELRTALDEIERLREQLPNSAGVSGSFDGVTDTRKVTLEFGGYDALLSQNTIMFEALEQMTDIDHDDPHWYMELAESTIAKVKGGATDESRT